MAREASARDVNVLTHLPEAIVLESTKVEIDLRRHDFGGALLQCGGSSRDVVVLLLDLYAAAESQPIGSFESIVFKLLSMCLPFDAGWTGVATHTPGGPLLHSSFLHQLPHQAFEDWVQVRHCDPLAQRTQRNFGRAAPLSVLEAGIDPSFRDWCVKYGLAHLMSVSALDHRSGLVTFLSVYRRALDAPFTLTEAHKVEDIVPHVAAALVINRRAQLQRLRGSVEALSARAICDQLGVLHQSDPGFVELLRKQWPECDSGKLPHALKHFLRARFPESYRGSLIHLNFKPVEGLVQIEGRPCSVLDRLSPRELVAIRHYGEGLSHKEVAAKMEISPTTVRHYLRCAYKKLGMHDKSQISGMLSL